MDEMPSSEFRRRYATLKLPVSVTALGRSIGVWVPAVDGTSIVMETALSGDRFGEGSEPRYRGPQKTVTITPGDGPPFNSRPFTPAPKKGK